MKLKICYELFYLEPAEWQIQMQIFSYNLLS